MKWLLWLYVMYDWFALWYVWLWLSMTFCIHVWYYVRMYCMGMGCYIWRKCSVLIRLHGSPKTTVDRSMAKCRSYLPEAVCRLYYRRWWLCAEHDTATDGLKPSDYGFVSTYMWLCTNLIMDVCQTYLPKAMCQYMVIDDSVSITFT